MTTVDERPRTTPSDAPVPALPALVAVGLAATSVGALLAHVTGLAAMGTVFWLFSLPSLVALAVIGAKGPESWAPLRRRIQLGAFGGVIGALGYDLFRAPFVVAGFRLFAPIDSYGLLLSGSDLSSPLTGTLGWLFHLSNGATFGVMYAVAMARRHWGWGVLWGLVLETAMLVTPFRSRYGFTVALTPVVIAYVAHLAFGYPLGRMVQRFDFWSRELRDALRYPATVAIGVFAIAVVIWQRPWSSSEALDEARAATAETGVPTVVIERSSFVPEWVRTSPGECIDVINETDLEAETPFGRIAAEDTSRLCFEKEGAHRVRLPGAFSGGFVYADPER